MAQAVSELVTLWVPIVGDGIEGDPYRPDLPKGMAYQAEIPSELDPALPVRDAVFSNQPHRGSPAVTHCRVKVKAEDTSKITNAVAEQDVSEQDRLLINVCAVIRLPRSVVNEAAVETIFNELGSLSAAADERKEMAVRLLEHSGYRGLSAAKRLEIAEQLGVADLEVELK